jgi:phosphoglycerol transferase MdoB-like AlkP superfamily enzyme
MKKRLSAFSIYVLFWLLFFVLARLFFIVWQYKEAINYSPGILIATFWYGLKLDISAVGYFMLLPVLFSIPGVFFTGTWYRTFIKYYTYLLIFFSVLVIISDALLYTYWGFRMDCTPIQYLSNPHDALASLSTVKIILMVAILVIISYVNILLYNKFIDKAFTGFGKTRYGIPAIIFLLILWASLIIPIRGGFGLAPINAGTVYFNENLFPNHTAINVVWNVGSSLFTQKPTSNPYKFGETSAEVRMVNNLTMAKEPPEKLLNFQQPNILIIVLESFGSYLIGPLGGDPEATPCFNKYINEGVLFSHFYATGNRTDKAIPAILTGYPGQPKTSIIKDPKKTQSLPNIAIILGEKGYNESFWYGGDINFANFNSFVIASGFSSIITKNNFNSKDYNSKWGVHDHIMFNALQDSLKKMKQPFFCTALTLSSHEPFEVPMETVFKGEDEVMKFKNSVYYTDKTLGAFLDKAKNSDWWNNTLIILVADHCRRNSVRTPVYSQEIFKIPMLWLGGALFKKGIVIDKVGSQVDIPITILGQLDLKGDFPFSKDLLSNESNSFAFYAFNEGFAFITDSSSAIYDCKLKKSIVLEGKNPVFAETNGKAFLQVLFDDYLKR